MAWVLDEVTERAAEYFKDHDTIEMVIRNFRKQFAPFEFPKIKWVDEIKNNPINQNQIRNVVRHLNQNNKKLDQIIPKLDQIFQPLQNMQILSILNTALSAANLVATVAGMIMICHKLDNIDHKLDEIQKEVADIKEINYEIQIAKPCRKLVDDYKLLSPALSKGVIVPEETLVNLIRECKDFIISIYNLRNNLPLDAVLSLIFMLLLEMLWQSRR